MYFVLEMRFRFQGQLLKLTEKLGSLIETFKAIEDQISAGGSAAEIDVTSRIDLGKKVELKDADDGVNRTVGLDEELARVLDLVTNDSSDRTVISIVGMGGMGKTTLARQVFSNRLVVEHFPIRLFVEIGTEWDLKEILLNLVYQVVPDGREELLTVENLGERLYKCLYGIRYLIVLDDIWDTEVWDRLEHFIPYNKNGSAIILTTRLSNVAYYGSRNGIIIQKRFLDDDESWDLLQSLAFSGMESCPRELIEIGKKIVRSLGGLPLAIVIIGKLLYKSEVSVKTWSSVAQLIHSHTRDPDETIPYVVDLSYTQLPAHLKPCFLYLGLFPPDYAIPAAQLIKLWVAEGFIVPVADKRLEQVAEEYLEVLVSTSLVTVHELNSRGKTKTCRLHSIIWDLCASKSQQENLFRTFDQDGNSFPKHTKYQRRLGIHSHTILGSKLLESVSAPRSLVFAFRPTEDHQQHHQLQMSRNFRGLRVLDALPLRSWKFHDEVCKLGRLRYLAITYDDELPSSISMLWNLEVLIIRRSEGMSSPVSLPLEIWKLHKLRHIEYRGCYLPDPSTGSSLENLLTLSGVCAHSVTPGVLARMPNLAKLSIMIAFFSSSVEYSDLTNLQCLESFKLGIMTRYLRLEAAAAASSPIRFHFALRKISLSGTGFPWEYIASIAALPHLQVLKLRWSAFCGPVWEAFDGGFPGLKVLLLEDLDVEFIIAESFHFPFLRHLLIRRCYRLREIPIDLGDIPTLETIEVDDCSMSLVESTKMILQEQEELGNDYLQVRIYPHE